MSCLNLTEKKRIVVSIQIKAHSEYNFLRSFPTTYLKGKQRVKDSTVLYQKINFI